MSNKEAISYEYHLISEGYTALELIENAFATLQLGMNDAEERKNAVIQLLAMGIERFVKYCYLAIPGEDYLKVGNKREPRVKKSRKASHDFVGLIRDYVNECSEIHDNSQKDSNFCEDKEFIENDFVLNELLSILKDFGVGERYYNLDALQEQNKEKIVSKDSPLQRWNSLEMKIWQESCPDAKSEDRQKYIQSLSRATKIATVKIIGKVERFMRAFLRCFTLYGSKNVRNRSFVALFQPGFLSLKDYELGKKLYFKKEEKKYNFVQKSKTQVLASKWPVKVLKAEDFPGKWNYIGLDECIVELSENNFPVVYLNGLACALNGTSSQKYGYPDAHDMSRLYLGEDDSHIRLAAMELK